MIQKQRAEHDQQKHQNTEYFLEIGDINGHVGKQQRRIEDFAQQVVLLGLESSVDKIPAVGDQISCDESGEGERMVVGDDVFPESAQTLAEQAGLGRLLSEDVDGVLG